MVTFYSGDLNGDGRPDLIEYFAGNADYQPYIKALNDNIHGFPRTPQTNNKPQSLVIGDIDNNGKDNIIVIDYTAASCNPNNENDCIDFKIFSLEYDTQNDSFAILSIPFISKKKYEELKKKYREEKKSKVKGGGIFIYFIISLVSYILLVNLLDV